MAVAYRTSSTTSWAARATLTLTKPTSTADGDLLIAIIGIAEGTLTVNSVPSGWSLIRTDPLAVSRLYTYSKIAASEGASWDWGLTGTDDCAGIVLRLDGQSLITPVYASNGDTESNDDTPPLANTITPTVANSFLIFAFLGVQAADVASYAITTSNPSWTEHEQVGPTTGFTLSVATATRPETTATGDSTLTGSGGGNTLDSMGQMIAVAPRVDVTASPTVSTLTMATSLDATATGGSSVSPTVSSLTATAPDATASTVAKKWSNTSKSSAPTWSNTSKS